MAKILVISDDGTHRTEIRDLADGSPYDEPAYVIRCDTHGVLPAEDYPPTTDVADALQWAEVHVDRS